MFPESLRLLLKIRWKATGRRMVRGARTVKGALYLLFMIGLVGLWFGPSIAIGLTSERTAAAAVRPNIASGLLAYCLLTLLSMGSESGLLFQAAEVDLLFPGPYTRKQLLVYKLAGHAIGCMVVSIFLSVFLLKHVSWWVAGYVGALFTLWFITLVQASLALIIARVSEEAYTRARRVIFSVIGVAVFAALLQGIRGAGNTTIMGLLARMRDSTAGKCLLAPFDVFTRTMTAATLVPEFVGWGAVALAINALLLLFVLRLDANFFENSIKASQKLYDRMQRARRGGALANAVKAKDVRWRVPQLPWLRGAGPIAWRQLMVALRSTRGLTILIGIVSLFSIAPILIGGGGGSPLNPSVYIGPLVMLSIFMLPQFLQFDFRGDIERLDVLKALPISGVSVVLGQLIAPVLMASLVQCVLLLAITATSVEAAIAVVPALVLIVPFNFLIFAVENVMFLLFPTKTAPGSPGDIQAIGRQMLMMFAKLAVLVIGGGLAAGCGFLAWIVTDRSTAAWVLTSALVLAGMGAALVPVIAIVYRRFDPSVDTPH